MFPCSERPEMLWERAFGVREMWVHPTSVNIYLWNLQQAFSELQFTYKAKLKTPLFQAKLWELNELVIRMDYQCFPHLLYQEPDEFLTMCCWSTRVSTECEESVLRSHQEPNGIFPGCF